jgi:translation elongation factor EF-4
LCKGKESRDGKEVIKERCEMERTREITIKLKGTGCKMNRTEKGNKYWI